MCFESSPDQIGNQETWALGLACGPGQVQSLSGPQFLLQITKGPGLGTEGPSISDFRVVRGWNFPYRCLAWAKVAQRVEDTPIIDSVTQKPETLCGPLLLPIPSPGFLCSKYLQLITTSCPPARLSHVGSLTPGFPASAC